MNLFACAVLAVYRLLLYPQIRMHLLQRAIQEAATAQNDRGRQGSKWQFLKPAFLRNGSFAKMAEKTMAEISVQMAEIHVQMAEKSGNGSFAFFAFREVAIFGQATPARCQFLWGFHLRVGHSCMEHLSV